MDLFAHLPLIALFFAVLALLCGALWLGRRSHGMLLWLSAAWAYAALGAAMLAWRGDSFGTAYIASVALACAACAHAAQAVAWRFGRRVNQLVAITGSVLALLGSAIGAYIPSLSAWHGYVIAIGLAIVAAHVWLQLWRMPSRHGAERSLLVAYGLWCMLIASGPWLTQAMSSGADSGVLMCLGAAAVAVAMVACVRADGFSLSPRRAAQTARVGIVQRATFEKSFNRPSAEQQISFLVLCDLDQFRNHHVQWGERVSGELLAEFAQLLQNSVRAGDHVVRVAHDEFALALRHIDRSNAQALVQRILEALRQQAWAKSGSAGLVTASFGVCMVRDNDTLEMALHRADVLLCQAKDAGGNRLAMEEGFGGVKLAAI